MSSFQKSKRVFLSTLPLCSFPPGEASLQLGKPESWKCATAPKWGRVGGTHRRKQPPAAAEIRWRRTAGTEGAQEEGAAVGTGKGRQASGTHPQVEASVIRRLLEGAVEENYSQGLRLPRGHGAPGLATSGSSPREQRLHSQFMWIFS